MATLSRFALFGAVFGLFAGLAKTAAAIGPENWQMGFQPAASPVMQQIQDFHDILLVIITLITLFVLGLLIYVMWRFSEKKNPTPSKTTHNTTLEFLWTVVPVIILALIVAPSFRLLYFADVVEDADMTIKAIGKQWYWSYEYPDHGNFTFDALLVPDEDIQEGQQRLLETDAAVVLPVETNIRILVTAGDVLHNFAVPSFGLKLDGVPGRMNETWTRVPAEFAGETFYGQCSELCGTGHAYMPIMIKMVTKAEFAEWTQWAKDEYARVDDPDNRVRVADGAAAQTAQ